MMSSFQQRSSQARHLTSTLNLSFLSIKFQLFFGKWKVCHLQLNQGKKKKMPYIPGDTVVFDPVNGWGFAGLDQANSESEMFSYNQVGLICNRWKPKNVWMSCA